MSLTMVGIVAALLAITAQRMQAATPTSSVKPAELTVFTSSSEGPVQGAIVILTSNAGTARTNISAANGLCRFVKVEAGTYSVRVTSRPFFIMPEAENELNQLEITEGQRLSINVRLTMGGVIAGKIVDSLGHPIIGIPVSAMTIMSGKTSLAQRQESNVTMVADDRGEFRIYGIRPGQYVIAVNAHRDTRQMRSVGTSYYPGERDINNARVFSIAAGQEIVVPDMTIDLEAVLQNSIGVTVVGSSGEQLKGVLLSLRKSDDGEISDSGATDETGHFLFEGLPAGKYSCKLVPKGKGYFTAEQEVIVQDRANDDVVVRMRSFPVIAGNVYLRQGTEVKPFSMADLSLKQSGRGEVIDMRVDANGAFSVSTGFEGNFWWSFPQIGRGTYLESVRLLDVDVTDRPVKLDRVAEFKTFVVDFAEGAAAVTGQVRGQGLSDCSSYVVYAVGLKGVGKEILFVKKADICSEKLFGIYSLRPGRYCIVALPIERPDRNRVERSRSKSPELDDYDYGLIESAIAGINRIENRILTLESRQVHEDAEPLLLPRQSLTPRGIRSQ